MKVAPILSGATAGAAACAPGAPLDAAMGDAFANAVLEMTSSTGLGDAANEVARKDDVEQAGAGVPQREAAADVSTTSGPTDGAQASVRRLLALASWADLMLDRGSASAGEASSRGPEDSARGDGRAASGSDEGRSNGSSDGVPTQAVSPDTVLPVVPGLGFAQLPESHPGVEGEPRFSDRLATQRSIGSVATELPPAAPQLRGSSGGMDGTFADANVRLVAVETHVAAPGTARVAGAMISVRSSGEQPGPANNSAKAIAGADAAPDEAPAASAVSTPATAAARAKAAGILSREAAGIEPERSVAARTEPVERASAAAAPVESATAQIASSIIGAAATVSGKPSVASTAPGGTLGDQRSLEAVAPALSPRPETEAVKSIRIALAPVDLGSVDVRITMRGELLRVHLRFESADAANGVSADRFALSDALSASGLRLDHLVVDTQQTRMIETEQPAAGRGASDPLSSGGEDRRQGEGARRDGGKEWTRSPPGVGDSRIRRQDEAVDSGIFV